MKSKLFSHPRVLWSLSGGVDLHSDDALETLLTDPGKMRRMLQVIGPVDNSDAMSPNELLMRLRCAYASAAASHNDMEVQLPDLRRRFYQLCRRVLTSTSTQTNACDSCAMLVSGRGRRS